MSNYFEIIHKNLNRLYSEASENLAENLPATRSGDDFLFSAFGESCFLGPGRIKLGDHVETGPLGIVISLYALHVTSVPCQLTPFRAFRDMPDSMPYIGAFASHAEHVLVEHIAKIEHKADRIAHQFKSPQETTKEAGDFSFILYPLPKIALSYIFYRADDEFPATVTCLFSHNAAAFLPTDALADTGEYTSRKILDIL